MFVMKTDFKITENLSNLILTGLNFEIQGISLFGDGVRSKQGIAQ